MVSLSLTIEYALLGFLHQQPMHGYEIHQKLEDPQGLGMVWRVKQSRLYALLGKLEKEGFISAVLEPQETRPPRKVFHMTSSGQEVFLAWVKKPVESGRQIRQEFLAKFYFARTQERKTAERLIELQQTACNLWLQDLQEDVAAGADMQSYEWIVWQYRISQLHAMIAWLDSCQASLG